MRQLLFLSILFYSLTLNCMAQATFQKMYGGLGHTNWRVCHNQTIDGGYILAGTTNSFGTVNSDFWLIKIEQDGDVEWSKTYGGYSTDGVESIQQTSDNGFIILGSSGSFGPYELLLIKTDPQGNVEWSRSYGRSGYDAAVAVKQTLDGGYIIAGSTTTNGYDYCLIKVNSFGDIIWQRVFDLGSANEHITSIIPTSDGGYLLTGYKDSLSFTDNNYVILKTDSIGTLQWSKKYETYKDAFCYAAIETADYGFLLCGNVYDYGVGFDNALLIKTDSQGDTLWVKSYAIPADIEAYSIDETTDAGYVITGEIKNLSNGGRNIYLLKIDSIGGILWAKTYGVNTLNYSNSVIQTTDGGYSILGKTISTGGLGNQMYFIKTDSIGNSGCFDSVLIVTQLPIQLTIQQPTVQIIQWMSFVSHVANVDTSSGALYYTNCSSVGITDEVYEDKVEIYPNPGSEVMNFTINNISTQGEIQVFDISGVQVLTESFGSHNTISINISKLTAGVYFVKIINSERINCKKFIKAKL